MKDRFIYYPEGVCSMMIEIELDGDKIGDVAFTGGCNGNLNAISKLVKGMPVSEVIDKLEGTRCGFKETSCSDQMCKALRKAVAERGEQ